MKLSKPPGLLFILTQRYNATMILEYQRNGQNIEIITRANEYVPNEISRESEIDSLAL